MSAPQNGRYLQIEHEPISRLKPNSRNPRHHTPKQVRQIARSIEEFRLNWPVLVDANNQVIAGHGRLLALQALGWTEVPVIRLEHLSPAQSRAFMIADNRLAENSAWDDQLLAETLKELAELSLDFSLELTGFEMGEIDFRIESLSEKREDKPDAADTLPKKSDRPPITKADDLWLLDRLRRPQHISMIKSSIP